MLLHGNGPNGGQNITFLDSSINGISLTRNGDVRQGSITPYAPNYSSLFDGSSYINFGTNAAYAFGSGDFTVEAWVCQRDGSGTVFEVGAGAGGDWGLRIGGTFFVDFLIAGSVILTSSAALEGGLWYHVAVVRQGTSLKMYVNGVQAASATNSTNLSGSANATVGGDTSNLTGVHLSNVRWVKGTAVYTSAFAPPTSPLTAISGTSLLTCQSRYIVDASPVAAAPAFTGTPEVLAFEPFSMTAYSAAAQGGGMFLDGTGDWVATAANAALALGSGDFTIECWVYLPSAPVNAGIAGTGSAAGDWFLRAVNANNINFRVANVAIATATTMRLNQWVHIAVTRSGSTVTIWVNGQSGATGTDSTNLTANTIGIGAQNPSGAAPLLGHICDFRIVKGTAVYTSAFTPPTAPLTAISGTSLLASAQNASIFDNARQGEISTPSGVQTSTAQSKFNGSSIRLPGSAYALVNPALIFSNDLLSNFTIEAWIYIAGNSALNGASQRAATIMADTPSGAIGGLAWDFTIDGNGSTTGTGLSITRWVGGVPTTASIVSAISQGAWHHVAVSRQTGVAIWMALDGVVTSASGSAFGLVGNASVGPTIGGRPATNNQYLDGYMAEVRFTRGVARYVANYAVPTAPFPNQ